MGYLHKFLVGGAMNLGQLIIISISLSMDAFSLAIIYGTLGLDKKMTNLLSAMVGSFHFFYAYTW